MHTSNISSRYVLGVSVSPHDGSAALLRDGELVAMVEQERLSRNRYALGESPRDAIAACLGHEDIGLEDLAEIAIGWDVPALMEVEGAGPFDESAFSEWLLGDLAKVDGRIPPLRYVDHHMAHAASAFYTSGLSEAAILVVDARGESVGTTVAVGGDAGIETLRTWGTHLSLGAFYATAAAWAGMTILGAGKLMGLAAYGRPSQAVPLAAIPGGYEISGAPPADSPISTHQRHLYRELQKNFAEHNYPFGPGDPEEIMAHADFAASIQHGLEGVLLELARIARRESGCRNLVMAGGVALNCTANGRLIRSGIFDELWIPPFPHDAGVSVGAAFIADRASRSGRPTPPPRLPHAQWAPEADTPDADLLARLSGCELMRCDDSQLAATIAAELERGKLVAWWQGRAEVGLRALGARSILCDPRRREALVRANLVKGRETWRPLAPAVLAERADSVFDGPLPAAAEFMLAGWPVREQARPRLPAAVHVDGSARPQVVRPTQARYHGVIEAFRERTGVPAVINTSFNLAGEPIVLSARDAVDAFLRSELDVLALGDLVAIKPAGKRGSGRRTAPRRHREPEAISPVPWVKPPLQRPPKPAIVQYWHSEQPPEDVGELISGFRAGNPDLRHLLFSEASAEEFIAEHFGPRETAAFRACGLPAMQSDYLRCCAIYILGGIYADADLSCQRPLSSLIDDLDTGLMFGWERIPPVLATLGLSDELVFGEVERVGDYRWVNNDFFAFTPAHPLIELTLEIMTANIERRTADDIFAISGPGLFTSFYLLREVGSFESFLEHASHGRLKPVSRSFCEIIGDYDNLARALEGVHIPPLEERHRWVQHTFPAYKKTDAHWMRWSETIYR